MKKLLGLLMLTALFSCKTSQQLADKDTNAWKYEVECAGIGTDGTYLVKVWSYSENKKFSISQAKKNAVHGIIFKGFTGGKDGCVTQKALATNPNIESEKEEFFKAFFEEEQGKYMKYVSISSDGNIDAADRMKVGDFYKTGVIVSVHKDALRKDLETAGIIRSLNSGF